MKRALVIVAGLLGVLAVLTAAFMPPVAQPSPGPAWKARWPVAHGAFHVHSNKSDGTGTRDEIAAAAARAGLQFVILTDHGNGTTPADAPTYRSGVLCIDGVEISTDDGHYIALGLPPAPYPLGGHARDVVADVRRLGGIGIVAHPGSPKPALRWTDWSTPFDGLEWLNTDSEWRDEFVGSLGRVLLTYPMRPVETLASLLDRPRPVIDRWQHAMQQRRVPALAGADAHARFGLGRGSDPYDDYVFARVPDYETAFRAFSNRLVLDRPLGSDAPADAALILDAIRNGRMFTVIDGLAALGGFEFRGVAPPTLVAPGEYLDAQSATLEAEIAAPPGTVLVLVRDGEPVMESDTGAVRVGVGPESAAYRIEARLPGRPGVPWLLSNPIYVGMRDVHAHAAAPPRPQAAVVDRSGIATAAWRAEASDGLTSVLRQSALPDGTPALEWRFGLAPGERREQYAAMRFPVAEGFATHDRLLARAQSDRPRRVWAQLRAPGGERWGASIYLDETLQAFEIMFADFRPLGDVPARPDLARVDSVLLVVDTIHTVPGAAGTVWIPDLWLAR